MELLQTIIVRNLLVVVVVVGGLGDATADIQVSPKSKYCMQHPTFLSCNFLGVQEVRVDTVSDFVANIIHM